MLPIFYNKTGQQNNSNFIQIINPGHGLLLVFLISRKVLWARLPNQEVGRSNLKEMQCKK
jgi:hypothetical protein